MEYETIKLLKESEKSKVHLICSGERKYIRKELSGKHPVYEILRDNPHAGLPELKEIVISEDSTIIIEEYIEGQSAGSVDLSERQFRQIVRELCSVLEFLHGRGIIHRDIKPSNILLARDGHVRLIDFDAARMPREGKEQDTSLLGTRGFAPPEQYGFAQTDERTDIYSLGITLEQLLPEKSRNSRYRKILRKCTNLDPDKRYQSVGQLRRAFFPTGRNILCGCAAACLAVLIGLCVWKQPPLGSGTNLETENGESALTVLPAPGNVHWNGETGIALWDNVPESGVADELQFRLRLYRMDTAAEPNPQEDDLYHEGTWRVNRKNYDVIPYSLVVFLKQNGFYYYMVSAIGDNVHYTDSPYAMSDVFEYTGESAPPLPAPEGLAWRLVEENNTRYYYATWSNLDEYEDEDIFNVTFYDQAGAYVMNNTWSMEQIRNRGYGGISIPAQFLVSEQGSAYRFTVQVYSSRPNEYSPSPMPDPVPEEYFSPWLPFGFPK